LIDALKPAGSVLMAHLQFACIQLFSAGHEINR